MRHLPAPALRGGALLAVALIAACDSSKEPAAPEPSPSLTTQAAPAASADGQPLTEGQWSIEETADSAVASFAAAGKEPVLRIICDRGSGAVALIRVGIGDEPQIYTVAAGEQSAALQMSPSATGTPAMLAEIDPAQPIFAAFSDPAATIEIGGPDGPGLRLPGHTGISRVIQSCG